MYNPPDYLAYLFPPMGVDVMTWRNGINVPTRLLRSTRQRSRTSIASASGLVKFVRSVQKPTGGMDGPQRQKRAQMIPLLPVGGVIDHRFGIITTPGHKGIPSGILAGMDWAADNQAFTQEFEPSVFFPWLESMEPYRETCLFVPLPDWVGDAEATIRLFGMWRYRFTGWPCAFVAQDGQECLDLPDSQLWSALFVGGTTDWKLSEAAYSIIQEAQRLEKHIHIGRVNWWRRYQHFASMPGSERWTCDGTRTRFDGTEKTIEAWSDYMERNIQLRFPVPLRDCGG